MTQGELDERLGASELQNLSECGDGSSHVLTYPGLSVYFSDAKLAGWSVLYRTTRPGSRRLAGISLYVHAVSRWQHAYDDKVKVFEPPWGNESTAPDGISGLFEDDSPSATVATFWSGTTCIAR